MLAGLVFVAFDIGDLSFRNSQPFAERLVLNHAVLAIIAVGRFQDQQLLGGPFEFTVLEDRHHDIREHRTELRGVAEYFEDIEQHLEPLLRLVVKGNRLGVGLGAFYKRN